ncbi:uracil-DNA glycosylase [Kiritimatiella glycovorans]|uniref:Type-4 uracil-DNA glycosylase n=1 Tax=Kiritimatiella glycovorans TaxID=1307763 RepID=A0A0G3EDY7_9BACT|nr:uracil-DNA glycosylase [Kiritimatiella glycovorans]AKJ64523.1 uracil-DNA glycosylase, family 4 [Kiritimatiella glycovorans]
MDTDHKRRMAKQIREYAAYAKDEGEPVEVKPDTMDDLEKSFEASSTSTGPAVDPGSVAPAAGAILEYDSLEAVAAAVAECEKCRLCRHRNCTVPGEGPLRPDVMFIGEGPGAEEDRQGRPFVGRAGKLLDKMIAAMGFAREEVFIGNIVKCRAHNTSTGKDRPPSPDEMDACIPYLRAQIGIIRPKVIVALGKTSVMGLLHKEVAITRFRGSWQTYEGVDLMPTFHPSYLLRSPSQKRPAWEDLQEVLRKLGRPVPNRDG